MVVVYLWYSLLLLAIQIFCVVVLEYYGLATKSPEGVIARLGRNLSRVLIFIIFIGTIVRFAYYGDYYAILELMLLSVFFLFNEINAWKVRSERKHWKKNEISESSHKREEITRANPKTSREVS